MSALLEYFEVNWQDLLAIVIKIALILIIVAVAVRIVKHLFKKITGKVGASGRDTGYLRFFRYVVVAIIYFIGVATVIAELPGLDNLVTTILAGSGIIAVVIGIASQQAAGNLVSGALILVFKPFKVGDRVTYISADKSGVVEEIGFRHTVIRTAQNQRLMIPNSLMNSNIVENANYGEDEISFYLKISVTYDSDTQLAIGIMGEVILGHAGFIDKRTDRQIAENTPPVNVMVKDFGDSAIIIQSAVWARNTAAGGQMKSDLLLEIKRRFELEGISFAYPTLTIESRQNNSL